MLSSTKAIVLHTLKYADKKSISKLYTLDYGLINVNINVGSSPKSKIKPAIIQALSQLEIVVLLKENKDIHQLIEAKPYYIYNSLSTNFSKLCIAQFINEVLYKCLKEQQANSELFEFVTHIYQWLDTETENFNNLHVYVLFELTKYLGFKPSNNKTHHDKYFDTREGKFQSITQSFPLGFDDYQSELFTKLFDFNLNTPLLFNKLERQCLLECLMAYYKMHLPNIHEFKSYQVLQDTMNG